MLLGCLYGLCVAYTSVGSKNVFPKWIGVVFFFFFLLIKRGEIKWFVGGGEVTHNYRRTTFWIKHDTSIIRSFLSSQLNKRVLSNKRINILRPSFDPCHPANVFSFFVRRAPLEIDPLHTKTRTPFDFHACNTYVSIVWSIIYRLKKHII